ncbi:MAG: endonuclease domain-containing protein [Xanthobacteraceae bacterium]
MWRLLRDRRFEGLKFRRQFPFQNYILDFVCFKPRVVIEIDGSQHIGAVRDQHRAKALQKEGFEIIRYWNNDLLQRPASVLEDLFHRLGRLKTTDPSPGSSLRSEPPSPTGGERVRTSLDRVSLKKRKVAQRNEASSRSDPCPPHPPSDAQQFSQLSRREFFGRAKPRRALRAERRWQNQSA